MHEDIPAFLVDLGSLDILLAAADFYGAAAEADWSLADDPRRGIPMMRVKGESHACVMLEHHFRRLFSPSPPPEGAEATAFLMRRPGRENRAFVIRRDFEMVAYPLREFRLPPRGLRVYLGCLGLAALRFSGPGRLQYLVKAAALEPVSDRGRSP